MIHGFMGGGYAMLSVLKSLNCLEVRQKQQVNLDF